MSRDGTGSRDQTLAIIFYFKILLLVGVGPFKYHVISREEGGVSRMITFDHKGGPEMAQNYHAQGVHDQRGSRRGEVCQMITLDHKGEEEVHIGPKINLVILEQSL